MIDLALLRNNVQAHKEKILKKDPSFSVDVLLKLDEQVRACLLEVETLRQKKNDLAQQAKGGVTPELRDQSIALGKDLKTKGQELEQAQSAFNDCYLTCPNLCQDDVPEGNKESNKVVKTIGEKPNFTFTPKNHLDLGKELGWFDWERAAKMSGAQFPFYKGDATKLVYALTQVMLRNNAKHGFEVVLPPYLVNEETLTTSGNFPKFKDEVYAAQDGLYLIPTAEVSLTGYHRDEILAADQLPVRMTSWTSCFRREAGGYGKTERGLIRIHQFEKVELFAISEPEKSGDELNRMVACAEDLLNQLGLHYQISLLAAQDCSFQSAKTFDIEVWLPTQEQYYEVSSASNCSDFQARRGKIRYRKAAGEKPQLVHTLNASSLAIPRLMVALMETYQQEDGTIALPEVLKAHMW